MNRNDLLDHRDKLLAEVRHLTNEIARKDSVFEAACAEVGQSRRLLEAGERLAEIAEKIKAAAAGRRLDDDARMFVGMIQDALTAYEEAAK